MRYLAASDLANLLAPGEIIFALEQSLRDFALGQVNIPDRQKIRFRVQGAWQAIFACAVRGVTNIYFLVRSNVTGRRVIDLRRTTAVKSVGLALYDLYAAEAFYARARSAGRGVLLQEEFDGVTRHG